MFLVFGGTGGTGQHFIRLALAEGHRVRALVRTPAKLELQDQVHQSSNLELVTGSITDSDSILPQSLDSLLINVDYVVCMLGDKVLQSQQKICLPFIQLLIPSMRRNGVKRILYQAGGLSKPYNGSLSPILWILRNTIARSFNGQHEDNEAVMKYFGEECTPAKGNGNGKGKGDIEWIVHRAGIYGDGPSKGRLERSGERYSIGVHRDCAEYNYRIVRDEEAVYTSDFSYYP
jgi:nucleoside-diphosphate-sugar epimerase